MGLIIILVGLSGLLIFMSIDNKKRVLKEVCTRHDWILKPSGFENVDYMVCRICRWVPAIDGFEADER